MHWLDAAGRKVQCGYAPVVQAEDVRESSVPCYSQEDRVGADELEESWRIVDPVNVRYKADRFNHCLHVYNNVGTRGLSASEDLMAPWGYMRQVSSNSGLLKRGGELGSLTVHKTPNSAGETRAL